ncbi:MAG: TetR/AcrR family transcriptional regulator [Candidatus Hydrogenedentes bacterium]|nr:TetR/AcrR family transcriptional regulator [Candidatus Hydrogenedentota bacterium]
MTKVESTDRRRSDTREKILEVAEVLIAKHGVEGFQLKEVAERVGVRPPSIFAHFEGRYAIAEAVSERLLLGIIHQLGEDDSGDPEVVLKRWARDLVSYLASNPAQIRLILRDLAQAGSVAKGHFECTDRLLDQINARVGAIVQRGLDQGRFRRVRPEALSAQFIGALVTTMVWSGWDENGYPIPSVPIDVVQEEAEALVMGLVCVLDRSSAPTGP